MDPDAVPDDAVSFDDLLTIKENYQPLKQGRNPHALKAALSFSPEQRRQLLHKIQVSSSAIEASNDFTTAIEEWADLIEFIQQSYVQGDLVIKLQPILERASNHLVALPNADLQNPILCNIWLRYIDTLREKDEVFIHMHSAGIAINLADFYLAWAEAAEDVGDFQKANSAIEKGISRKAEPTHLLKSRQAQLQQRLVQATLAKHQAGGFQPTQQPKRSAFSSLPTSGSANTFQRLGAPVRPATISRSMVQSASKVNVFSGPETAKPLTFKKPTLAPLHHRQKENTRAPTSWSGQVIQQKPPKPMFTMSAPVHIPIVPFVEEDVEQDDPSTFQPNTKVLRSI